VKDQDHLMDAMRYLIMSARERMRSKPMPPKLELAYNLSTDYGQRWMQ
jgi:hypothetical protein